MSKDGSSLTPNDRTLQLFSSGLTPLSKQTYHAPSILFKNYFKRDTNWCRCKKYPNCGEKSPAENKHNFEPIFYFGSWENNYCWTIVLLDYCVFSSLPRILKFCCTLGT